MTAATAQTNQFEDLKEIVSKTLEKQGILAKAQAQLRKHVFEALSTTEQQNGSNYNVSPKIDENDINDKFALALIRDFLEYHHLDYTLSLMNTESQKKMEVTQNITRNEIASRLGLGAQKPDPDCSLLNQLVKKLFDSDVFQPRNSTLNNDIKLKPRHSNDSYRSTLDSTFHTPPLQTNEIMDNNNSDRNHDSLQNLSFSLPTSKALPPLSIKQTNNTLKVDDIDENMDIDIDDLIEEATPNDTNKEEEYVDPLDDILESSSNEDNEEQENKDEFKQMSLSMERLRQRATEIENLTKEPIQSANSSQTHTEYEDDFGSEVNTVISEQKESYTETNTVISNDTYDIDIDIEDDIDDEIDEDIEIDVVSQSISEIDDDDSDGNIYCVKDIDDEVNDKPITNDLKLENVADIIMDVKTEKIKYQF